MKAYITGSGIISPQETHNNPGFPDSISNVFGDRLTCIEPDYRGLINPVQLRRMPRILRMGLASAQLCINRAGGVKPDAIVVGTGLGCLDNLEKFLIELLTTHEHITSVLPFINSTHNAVAAQVAMLLQNHGYNVTYCHRGFSFESALDDAMMLIEERTARHILVGGIDECTADFMHLHAYLRYWKEPLNNLSILTDKSYGTIAGEGSAFFMLSADPAGTFPVSIDGLHTFFIPAGAGYHDIVPEIDRFLDTQGIGKHELGLVLTGINGDAGFDKIYYDLSQDYFSSDTGIAWYKHLCGEYYTSTSFALWLASVILERQIIPPVVQLTPYRGERLNKLLIYNHIRNSEHAVILLSHGKI
jgi:3-oxoacyl-(acyl-carrier-protein) synthase